MLLRLVAIEDRGVGQVVNRFGGDEAGDAESTFDMNVEWFVESVGWVPARLGLANIERSC